MSTKRKPENKVIVGKAPSNSGAISVGSVPAARQWTFSFKYLRQVEYFGTGNQDAPWFISILEKMSDLCAKRVEDVLSNPAEKSFWRLHEIDWNHKGVPIERSSLNWIDAKYLGNPTEYPFWQFSVSKALGRIIGFWDEKGVFNIVLLDPSHNLQPSQYSDYKTREAPIGKGEFETAIVKIEEKIKDCGDDCSCRNLYPEIQSALTHRLEFSTLLISMPSELYDRVTATVQSGLATCVSDLLDVAVSSLVAPSA